MKISQNKARELKRRIKVLEAQISNQRRLWNREYPGGVYVAYWQPGQDFVFGLMRGAYLTGHAIVAVPNDKGRVDFYALPNS